MRLQAEQVTRWLQLPFALQLLEKRIRRAERVLDAGCGQTKPAAFVRFFPEIDYVGVDLYPPAAPAGRVTLHQGDLHDFDEAWAVPGGYDIVFFSHVIEHLDDGVAVMGRLATLLKPGGVLFMETPHPVSVRFPHLAGTLNFWDDPTHVRPYHEAEVEQGLRDSGLIDVRVSRRRSAKRIALAPAQVALSVARRQPFATALWDVSGFAFYGTGRAPALTSAAARVSADR